MRSKVPKSIRDEAYKMYLDGSGPSKIAEDLTAKHDLQITAQHISSWVQKGGWADKQRQAIVISQTAVVNERAKILIDNQKAAIEAYNKLWKKSANELHLNADDIPIGFDKPIDAVKALDIGIQGERRIQAGLVNVELISRIFQIITEEIDDEHTIDKLAARFRQVAAEIS